MLALVRPADWNWILLCHLLAAFALVAGVILVSLTSLAAARSGRPEQVPLLRTVAFRTNLLVVVPAFVGIHVFGAMLADREFPDDEPAWLGASFTVTTHLASRTVVDSGVASSTGSILQEEQR